MKKTSQWFILFGFFFDLLINALRTIVIIYSSTKALTITMNVYLMTEFLASAAGRRGGAPELD